MRRVFLTFLCVGLLAVAGSVLMAQTDYGSSDQPAADTTATSNPQSDTDRVSGTTGTTAPETNPNPNDPVTAPNTTTPPNTTTTTTDTTTSSTVQDRSTLPRTASNTPLVLAIGLFALAGIVLMRVYRIRYAR
jgi:uncharacterized surface anchored protein